MKKQNFLILLCFLLMGYMIPTKANTYCTPSGTTHNSGNSYVKTITSTGGTTNLNYETSSMPSSLLTYVGEATVRQGGTLSVNLVANNLGGYSTTTVRQDLRYNVAYYFVDWNQDGIFSTNEYSDLCGRTSHEGLDNVGGNANEGYNVLDITQTIAIPENTAVGKYRVRVVYTNAWVNRSELPRMACMSIMEGVVYDYDINVESAIVASYTVTAGEAINGTFVLKNGEEIINSGDELPEGTIITVVGSPNRNMRLDEIRVNDVAIEGTSFELTENVVVSVKFSSFWVLTYSAVGNGQVVAREYEAEVVLPSGTRYTEATVFDFEVIPEEGYELSSFMFNGSEKKDYVKNNHYGAGGELDINVVATFARIMHTITIPAVEYGKVTVFNGLVPVNDGDKVVTGSELTINFAPIAGASLKLFSVNGVDKTADVVNNRYVMTATENLEFKVEFKVTLYTLSLLNDNPEFGSLEVMNDETGLPCVHGDKLVKGSNITITITPKDGYLLGHFYENGAEVTDIESYYDPESKNYQYWPSSINSDVSYKTTFAVADGVSATKAEAAYYDASSNRLVIPAGAHATIYSITGESILELNSSSELNELKKGCYLAKVVTENGSLILKFIRK
ncbi:MAG: GEVED domain-containing protein [Bacteroidales bacterium]